MSDKLHETIRPTKRWPSQEGAALTEAELNEAAALLAAGGTVAFPTETVYGLGADARSSEAVEQVFRAKGRPSDNPLIVHIAGMEQLVGLVRPLNETELRLAERFWPGPLTLVLRALPGSVSPRVTAGLDTVAVRMPDHEVALRLIRAAGCPVAAPSANRSGRPSPTAARHVQEDLAGRISGIVDGGPTGVGLESTVAECAGPGSVRILRPGGVTPEQLRAAGFDVQLEAAPAGGHADPELAFQTGRDALEGAGGPGSAPRSPGMKYAHYAPRGEMRLVAGPRERVRATIQAAADEARGHGRRVGILAYEETADAYRADIVLACGSLAALETAAQSLYAVLREFDERGAELIWAEGCPPDGIGLALMNRLSKAAGGRVELLD
ncbi:threonylcarbamoyl-AMP synthase [Paenibacillus albicereus]|uniref:Threonylcarbamoyl-AMP synthase n=1 Tax=Paenibacillus albicereus TaxID=2726185 RepID=A0A6H2H2H0_9BACL|nr:L-threonylcarbamoyladenylate synthase [Paenibacillus albicereus]QJC53835.1 threonylcarbamoyl-AMP synthase [Paenibacillus albicereus]